MSTNYYLHHAACEHCGRSDGPRHIGKSSAGWTFLFRGYDTPCLKSWRDWSEYIVQCFAGGGYIKDEYDRKLDLGEFLYRIKIVAGSKQRKHELAPGDWSDFGYTFSYAAFS